MTLLKRFGRLLPLLTLVAGVALGMKIQQRLTGKPAPPPPAPATGALAPAPPPGQSGLPPMDIPPDSKVFGPEGGKKPRMQGWGNGRQQYNFEVDKLVMFPDQSAMAEGIAGGTLLAADGKPTIMFTAQRAIMNTTTYDLDVQGQVRVNSTDPKNPVVFVTRDMKWLAAQEKLVCPNPVEVTRPGIILRGAKMTADVRLKRLDLDGDIYLEAEMNEVEKRLGLNKPAKSGGKRR